MDEVFKELCGCIETYDANTVKNITEIQIAIPQKFEERLAALEAENDAKFQEQNETYTKTLDCEIVKINEAIENNFKA